MAGTYSALPAGPAYDHLNKLVPELRRRGLFRNEYEDATLHENLGLSRASNQFFSGSQKAAD